MKAWELHPALAHFPVALLFTAFAADLWTARRPSETRSRTAAGLYVAGVLSALPTAAAGVLAWYTAPHSGAVHALMVWHPLVAIASVILFGILAVKRWRSRTLPPTSTQQLLALAAALLLGVAGSLGGYLVFRGGVGVSTCGDPSAERDQHPHGPIQP